VIDKQSAKKEGIGIYHLEARNKERSAKTDSFLLRFSVIFGFLQKSLVVGDFFLLLAKGGDQANGVQSLLGVAGTLTIGFHGAFNAALQLGGCDGHPEKQEGRDSQDHQGQVPAFHEAKYHTTYEHGEGEDHDAKLLAKASLDVHDLLVHTGRNFSVVVGVKERGV